MVPIDKVVALSEIVASCALDGDAWGALAAQLSADVLVLTDVLAMFPAARIDESVVTSPVISGSSLLPVIKEYRSGLLASLHDSRLASVVEAAFTPLDAIDLPLLPENPEGYAQSWGRGQHAHSYLEYHQEMAARLYRLAAKLLQEGDRDAFGRTVHAADTSTFLAHHALESRRVGDNHLTLLRTGMLLADYANATLSAATDAITAARESREALEWATLLIEKPVWGVQIP